MYLRFKDLGVGDRFEFHHENPIGWQGAIGPWIKLSPRRYRRSEVALGRHDEEYCVGTINVRVNRV